ncbi:hypothetical protein SLA2020_410990 [Shorea laevis]
MGGALLGLPGPWAKDNSESSDHYTTKIGGLPDWPFPRDAINPGLLECSQCGSKLCLVAQVYAPISIEDLKIEERLLLVFGCVTPTCGGTPLSWRAVRIQKVENVNESSPIVTPEKSESPVSVSTSKWWGSLDDDDDEDIDLEELGKAFAETASVTPESKKSDSKQHTKGVVKPSSLSPQARVVDKDTPVMPCFYIYTEDEPSSRGVSSVCSSYSSLSINEKDSDLEDPGQEETWEAESYEYDKALTADRTYLKFKKKLDASPEQCFRYAFGEKPLLATKEIGDPGKCKLCGALRCFEIQLMPPLIYFLQEEADDLQTKILETWNWLMLAVYTCCKSCSKKSDQDKSSCGGWVVAEETVILQSDETLQECSQRGYFS